MKLTHDNILPVGRDKGGGRPYCHTLMSDWLGSPTKSQTVDLFGSRSLTLSLKGGT